ncbi:MAG: Fic family protein, partial [Deltaproteobacteria bacterium]|nr:Fic family protein [Deltaproteobacteria bacterium]
MPKKIPIEEFEAVVTVVAAHPGGAKIDAIRKGLGITLPDRMLQRRLRRLADEGRIVTKGTGKGKRYFPKRSPKPEAGEKNRSTPATGGIRLSANGKAIKQSVLRSVSERTPVGYQSEFLTFYEPNTTTYISDELQRELKEMGQVGQADLPAGTHLRQVMDRLLIDLSWNSSRLEGNTYSLLDTQLLFERGDGAEGKTAKETQMILNHKSAIEMLVENAEGIGFNRYTICNLHALLSENLLPDPAAGGH